MAITSRENAGRASLDEWVDEVRGVYGRKDQERSTYDIWLHATRHAAAVGEEVRRNRPSAILEELCHFVLWLLTFVGRARAPLGELQRGERSPEESLFRVGHAYSDIVWNKYPNRCPVCFPPDAESTGRPIRCTCLLRQIREIEERNKAETDEDVRQKDRQKQMRSRAIRRYAHDHIGEKPATLDGLQSMFLETYRCNIERESLASIAFHLLEEVGEVADALVNIYSYHGRSPSRVRGSALESRLTQLEDEIADVTSWTFALVAKIDEARKDTRIVIARFFGAKESELGALILEPIRLGRILWSSYGSPDLEKLWCKHCKSARCRCRIVFLTQQEDVHSTARRVPVGQQ